MGVFHWGRLVGNYGFIEGWEQCLQSQLGSVVVSQLVVVDQQNIKHVCYFTDPPQLCIGILALPTWKMSCVSLYGLLDTLPQLVGSVLSNIVTILFGITFRQGGEGEGGIHERGSYTVNRGGSGQKACKDRLK